MHRYLRLLFDERYYRERYRASLGAADDLFRHYLERGGFKGWNPHPLFDASWYLQTNPDVAAAAENPLVHFLVHGAREGRNPHPLFHTYWYNRKYAALLRGSNPLLHYISVGHKAGCFPNALFDPLWYAERYDTDQTEGVESLADFCVNSLAARRDPHPLFSTSWYLERNPDVASAGVNPLQHYLEFGGAELRDPHPLFDSRHYLRELGNKINENPLVHFLTTGYLSNVSPHPLFDFDYYRAQCQPPLANQDNPLLHFLKSNATIADPNPLFSCRFYAGAHLQESTSANPLIHYIREGANKHHRPHPNFDSLDHFRRTPELWSSATLPMVHALRGRRPSRFGSHTGTATTEPVRASAEPSLLTKQDREEPSYVSVIFPNANDSLSPCLEALLRYPSVHKFDIAVVSSRPMSEQRAANNMSGDMHFLSDQGSFAANCVGALRQVKGQIIVVLCSSALPSPGLVDALAWRFGADPSVGYVGAKYLAPDQTLQEAGLVIWRDGSVLQFGAGNSPGAPQFNMMREVDAIGPGAIAIRRDVLEALTIECAENEELVAHCELAFRARSMGFRVLYEPKAQVVLSNRTIPLPRQLPKHFVDRWSATLLSSHFPPNETLILARDRSALRPRILIVDRFTPQIDRDAGSRSVFHYVRLFATHNFHVTFWSDDGEFDPYYSGILQDLGVEAIYSFNENEQSFSSWLVAYGQHLHYAFLSRPDVALRYLPLLRENSSAKILFYGHDVHHLRLLREFNATGRSEAKQEAESMRQVEEYLWQHCDVTYYPAQEEVETVKMQNPRAMARALPLFIFDNQKLQRTRDRLVQFRLSLSNKIIFVAGFRHAPNVDAARWFVSRVWPLVLAEAPDAELLLIGSFPPPEVCALASEQVTVTGAVSQQELEDSYHAAAASVVPLRFGAGVKGKILEALSEGTPVVTTTTGAQGIPDAESFLEVSDDPRAIADHLLNYLKSPTAHKPLLGVEFLMKCMSEFSAIKILSLEIPELGTHLQDYSSHK